MKRCVVRSVFLGIFWLIGCANQSPTTQDDLKPPPPASPPASTPATSTTTTTAQTPPPANQPPTVSIRGGGACHPSAPGSANGAQSCFVTFTADARDPDGDALSYSWTGCARGREPRAVCEIRNPGERRATVTVTDGRRGQATASAPATGTNAAPVAKITFGDYLPSNSFARSIEWQPEDPDGDENPNVLCERGTITSSGPCRAYLGLCGGVSDGLEVEVYTQTGPGVCAIVAMFPDSGGAVGRATASFLVEPAP